VTEQLHEFCAVTARLQLIEQLGELLFAHFSQCLRRKLRIRSGATNVGQRSGSFPAALDRGDDICCRGRG
jgi:hypothetical protein